jgi:anti-sigma factor RsiW
MTPCERFKDKIFDLIDQELDGPMREQVLQHIKECSLCEQFYHNLSSLKQGLSQMKPVKAPDSFQIVLRDRIRREMAHKSSPKRPQRRFLLWAAVFTVAAAAVITFLVYRPFTHSTASNPLNIQTLLNEQETPNVRYVIDDLDQEMHIPRSASAAVSRIDSLLGEESENLVSQLAQPVRF